MSENIKIPLARRIYPSLCANNIVSVQPLSQPSGLIFYLRHRYANNKQNPGMPFVHVDPPPALIPRPFRGIDDPWMPSKEW